MAYIGQEPGLGQAQRSIFTAVAVTDTVTADDDGLPLNYTVGQVSVYLNGVKQVVGDDVVADNGSTLVFDDDYAIGDVIEVIALSTFSPADTVPATGGTFSGNIIVPTATSSGHAVTKAQLDALTHTPEGTAVLSTSETIGKYLHADGDNTSSWKVIDEASYVAATGGTTATPSGDYKYHLFTSTGLGASGFVVTAVGNSFGSNHIEYLIIGAGGGGGCAYGAGAGAGGYRNSIVMCPPVGNYDVVIGAGGTGSSSCTSRVGRGTSGTRSIFNGIFAPGGGGGGGNYGDLYTSTGWDGASGGGSKGNADSIGGLGIDGHGFSGGEGEATGTYTGGGGGATAVGAVGPGSSIGGAGGAGKLFSNFTSYGTNSGYFCGGGGGGSQYSRGAGGIGGGAGGATQLGAVNTGGGGGGGGHGAPYYVAGNGGTGVVIIRYKYQN